MLYSMTLRQKPSKPSMEQVGRAKKMTYPAVRSALGIEANAPAGNIPTNSPHAVTVPGAASGWCDVVARYGSGKLSLLDILTPAIKLAFEGWPVSEVTAHSWKKHESMLLSSPNGRDLLLFDPLLNCYRAPRAGEIMTNPLIAHTFLCVGQAGCSAFYAPGNPIPDSIISVLSQAGSFLTVEDLSHHMTSGGSESTIPISYEFRGQGLLSCSNRSDCTTDARGLVVWEHAPPSAGLIALVALALFEEFERCGKIPVFSPQDFLSAAYIHAIIEAIRLAFKHAAKYVVSNFEAAQQILARRSLDRGSLLIERWAREFDPARALGKNMSGAQNARGSDTVYFSIIDSEGNGTSFVNSNYAEFGSGIVPPGTGFVLHNRGGGFSLDPRHEACLMPRQRPYHTLIPGLVTWGSTTCEFGEEEQPTAPPPIVLEAAAKARALMDTPSNVDTLSSSGATIIPDLKSQSTVPSSSRVENVSSLAEMPSQAPKTFDPTGTLHSLVGVKGGFVQPQGHLQVLLAQIVGRCNPQEALDAPRVCVGPGMPDPKFCGFDNLDRDGAFGGNWVVNVEGPLGPRGITDETVRGLRALGHDIKVCNDWDRNVFGRGQVIQVTYDQRLGRCVYAGGTDGRGDGIAMPL